MRTATGFTLTWHTDPGHGWLGVPLELLRDLGIQNDISSFSYIGRGVAYLEEDDDAPKFLTAFRQKFPDLTLKTPEVHTDAQHWIRRLQPYHVR
jgi:hypothetical protein